MIKTKEWLTKIWCWIVGHDTICMKRHSMVLEHMNDAHTTSSAFQCLRCKHTWQEQWDE